MNNKSDNKGITLIALVITIIVLLILAGVSIATLTGQNGILTQSNVAKESTEMKGLEEQANLVKTEMQINEYWKKQELTQSNLLNAINLELEGSTLQGNRVITSDEKYAVVVKNDENLTIEVIKNEEGVLAEGELGLQLEFVQDMNMIYIYPQIGGVETYKQYAERILAEKTKGEKEQILIDSTGMSSEEFYQDLKENMRGRFYR